MEDEFITIYPTIIKFPESMRYIRDYIFIGINEQDDLIFESIYNRSPRGVFCINEVLILMPDGNFRSHETVCLFDGFYNLKLPFISNIEETHKKILLRCDNYNKDNYHNFPIIYFDNGNILYMSRLFLSLYDAEGNVLTCGIPSIDGGWLYAIIELHDNKFIIIDCMLRISIISIIFEKDLQKYSIKILHTNYKLDRMYETSGFFKLSMCLTSQYNIIFAPTYGVCSVQNIFYFDIKPIIKLAENGIFAPMREKID